MTLKNRLDRYPAPSLIIVDEAHRALAPSYLAIAEAYPKASIVGLTATPQRTDGKGLGHLFNDIVLGPSIRYLIQEKYLCDYELFGLPTQGDVSRVPKRGGDFATDELSREMNKPKITGNAVDHYKQHCQGEKAVVMCVDVAHAVAVAEMFNAAGVRSEAIHGGSSDRDGILTRFESGQTDVLTSVQLLVEGVDLPVISVVIWLRPTMSLVVWMQGNGRGLRPCAGKSHLKIFDHVGNWSRHGLPDTEREWSLESRVKRKRAVSDEPDLSVQVCENCHLAFLSGVRTCPHCQHAVPFRERKIETIEGELQRIREAEAIQAERKARRQEQGAAQGLKDLIQIGISRKMKNPAGWAANLVAAREGRRATTRDYAEAKNIQQELHTKNETRV
jgi:superfamily II DNA or RNA helicase